MMLILTRVKSTESKGQPGRIQTATHDYSTMEVRWNNNAPFTSCVPPGIYEMIPYVSSRYGECYVIVNEQLNVFFSERSPNRPSDGRYKCIYFHRGNWPSDFEGCGGVGERYLPSEDMITNTTQISRIVNTYLKDKGVRLLNIVDEM